MIYKSENQIKMILGINAWRNLLNDKIVRFTTMMPDMENEVMLSLIKQLPQFWLFSKETLTYLGKNITAEQLAEQSNMHEMHKIINSELGGEKYSSEEKGIFIETILQCLDQELELDNKDRSFINSLQKNNTVTTRLAIMAVLSYLGGKLRLAGLQDDHSIII